MFAEMAFIKEYKKKFPEAYASMMARADLALREIDVEQFTADRAAQDYLRESRKERTVI